jgi:hypothetical protein
MKYIIYEMVQPDCLKITGRDGDYCQPVDIDRHVLEEINIHGVEEKHDTMESAIAEINDKKDKLKHLQLTVLPVFTISWDGEVY